MSNKTLFIGGTADGRRIETAESDRYHMVSVPGGGTEEYYFVRLKLNSGEVLIYVLTGMSLAEAFNRLIDFYAAPDKSTRERALIEESLLLLLREQPLWNPELLIEQFSAGDRQAARRKLWYLLDEKKVELTWDRRLRLLRAK